MKKNHSIELLRVMAAIAVIFIHVSTAPVGSATHAVHSSVLKNMELIHILMQWSVPVFFMITGFCLMQKDTCSYSYCFSKVLRYLGALFTVGLFYALLEGVFVAKTINVTVVTNAFKSVIGGYLWEHMWFVYSIIGIYLVMPVIHGFMQQEKQNIMFLTGLLFFFNILCPAINSFLPIGIEFPFDGYLVYVCFGGMVAKCNIEKKWKYISGIVIVLSILYLFVNVGKELFVFKHPVVCLMAMAVFLLISQAEVKENRAIIGIAPCTWGIYLIHPFFMNMALKVLKIDLLSGLLYVKLLMFAVVLFVISLVTTYILRKIPLIKKIF